MLRSDFTDRFDSLQFRTKPASAVLGRCLWTCSIATQHYWLKYQLPYIHADSEKAFQHELNFYQNITAQIREWLLPHQIIPVKDIPQLQQSVGQVLVLPETTLWFVQQNRPLSDLAAIYRYILNALLKLAELHQLGWIHGDLKAEHCRNFQEQMYFIDFEKSLYVSDKAETMDATPHYMAPELFQGQAKSIQSDLYAFGIILYEWLTQTRLQATSYYDWALLHCQKLEPVLPASFQIFEPLLLGLLQKHKQNRFKNSLEAVHCLNKISIKNNLCF